MTLFNSIHNDSAKYHNDSCGISCFSQICGVFPKSYVYFFSCAMFVGIRRKHFVGRSVLITSHVLGVDLLDSCTSCLVTSCDSLIFSTRLSDSRIVFYDVLIAFCLSPRSDFILEPWVVIQLGTALRHYLPFLEDTCFSELVMCILCVGVFDVGWAFVFGFRLSTLSNFSPSYRSDHTCT